MSRHLAKDTVDAHQTGRLLALIYGGGSRSAAARLGIPDTTTPLTGPSRSPALNPIENV